MRQSDRVTDCPRHAGRVLRYHTWVVHHHQSVGEHCWQVALVYEQIFGLIPPDVERYIRHHDTAELVVGDPPFPVKAKSPTLKAAYDALETEALLRLDVELPSLTQEERVKVKICDLLEMMTHGMTEREMGNLLAVPVVLRTQRVAENMAWSLSTEIGKVVDDWIMRQWSRHETVLKEGALGSRYSYDATVRRRGRL